MNGGCSSLGLTAATQAEEEVPLWIGWVNYNMLYCSLLT